MDMRHYATCLWPGLPELWWRGRLSALPAAIAFTAALNLILIARYLYPGWLHWGLVSMAFWIGVIAWGFFIARGARELPQLISPRSASDQPDRFPEAQIAYLKGRWQESETLLTEVLAIEPRDPPALLLLAGIYRHTSRFDSADLLMREVRRLEVVDTWVMEIEAETKRLEKALAAAQQEQEQEDVALVDPAPNSADMTATNRAAA